MESSPGMAWSQKVERNGGPDRSRGLIVRSRAAAFSRPWLQNIGRDGFRRTVYSLSLRPASNLDAIDIHLRGYRFFPPTPGTAAT